jgi:serine/threonine-protein kinase
VTPLSDGAVARLQRALHAAGEAPDADAPPDLTGTRYRLGERIGRGGMGAVYAAQDTALDREVALKVLDAALADADAARLAREARILARLEHPGIVPVHDVGTLADGRVFYTMKRVRGLRLDEHVRALDAADADDAGARARLAERLRLFAQVCDAVAFAHAHGVVHRDLKPENVMVGAFGEVLVLDWGIAKVLGAGDDEPAAVHGATGREGTLPGMVLGTPGYMAPEQARGESAAADGRSDVYALGGVLRFLLTGRGPREAGGDDAPLPRPLRSICRAALEPDPGRRYASVAALAADVARFAAGERVVAHRESAVERLGRWLERYRTPVALVAAYLVMRLLLLAWNRG